MQRFPDEGADILVFIPNVMHPLHAYVQHLGKRSVGISSKDHRRSMEVSMVREAVGGYSNCI